MKNHWINPIQLVALAAAFFIPFLGGVHLFDWDEINFAEIAREMLVLNNWLEPHINLEPFHEKPPFFMWLQAAAMNWLGVGELAARLPNALAGMLALPMLYFFGQRWANQRVGMLWSLAYLGSILPHLYFRSGIIDPWFNLFIFIGLALLFEASQRPHSQRLKYLVFAGAATGLAILTKGPAALLITFLVLASLWVMGRFHWFITFKQGLVYLVATGAVTGLWYGALTMANGPEFLVAFTLRQWALLTTPDAGHGGFPGYHVVVLLLGVFPASVFTLANMTAPKSTRNIPVRTWMLVLFWVVLILFSLVKSKIVHYSSLAYYPMTFLAALYLDQVISEKQKMARWVKVWFFVQLALMALVVLLIPYAGQNIQLLKPLFAADPFALENLDASVVWSGWEALSGVYMLGLGVLSMAIIYPLNKAGAIKTLFIGMAGWVTLTLYFFVGNIEGYSQRASVEFFESTAQEEAYRMSYRYRSYIPEFYGRVSPNNRHPRAGEAVWLLHGPIDKPVYISCKKGDVAAFQGEVADAVFLYNKNGFYFFKRLPPVRKPINTPDAAIPNGPSDTPVKP
jgi:4-amino-4-deoxy-L-arabinose transferase-like glycosyltransferase